MTLGSLFAGIGGFDLGFERAGFKTVWQVEKNAYCRRVLRRHFPHADRRVTDVRFGGARNLARVDVICGGFPCQDISNAGLRAGIDGARSGLWFHMHRIISELRPRYVVVENVAALLGRGMGRVLGDLSEIGYDAEWHVISAADVGAPHLRERVWTIAYPNGDGLEEDADETVLCGAIGVGPHGHVSAVGRENVWASPRPLGARPMGMGNGIPGEVDRLRALGNAVVPQIPELIARRLMEAMQ